MKQAANEVISIRQAQDAAAQVELAPHPLEFNAAEREWFLKACNNYVTAYRRAVQVPPGSLPSWAERQSAGRPQSISTEHHEEIRKLLTLGVSMSTVASRFDTSRATIARIRDAEGGK